MEENKISNLYKIENGYVSAQSPYFPYYTPRFEIRHKPEIGQKYEVVSYCDYDNEGGENYIVEVTAENIAEITFHMNDLNNDITEYVLIN